MPARDADRGSGRPVPDPGLVSRHVISRRIMSLSEAPANAATPALVTNKVQGTAVSGAGPLPTTTTRPRLSHLISPPYLAFSSPLAVRKRRIAPVFSSAALVLQFGSRPANQPRETPAVRHPDLYSSSTHAHTRTLVEPDDRRHRFSKLALFPL
ncbi:hypothetical protein CCHR01_00002 [Colletotrichum chrysophilum]|uniref:Uncharacterized protein n=1 Tax=Colletotrichum chrysophilum TaxID=1836956 RepID=A0AAD9EUK1_9PEZI|nr:hypothetical protein CCHR01_00002 [Colletotrichum chrysophilum]